MSKKYGILLSLFLWAQSLLPALAQGTLIRTPQGMIPIEQLAIGDAVLSYVIKEDAIIKNRITAISCKIHFNCYRISTPTAQLLVSSEQRFYDGVKRGWVRAAKVNARTQLLSGNGYSVPCISCEYIDQQIALYDLTLDSPHNFFITDDDLLVHNFAPFIILSFSFGGGIVFESIMFGLGAIGIKFFKDWYSKKTNIEVGAISNMKPSSDGLSQDPDKKNKEHPNGRYEDAPYHHQNSKGQKNMSPRDGQAALDNSLQIKNTSPHRISIQDDKFVVLKKTMEGLYHGYVCEWKELEFTMQQILRDAGWVTRAGKICK